jgi:citronellyl-CoA dehydrogenase
MWTSGQGLDYSDQAVVNEATGAIDCGGIPMAIGVQTDMATPALARFGSPELRRDFLRPAIAGDMVACLGVSEPEAGSDVASIRSRAVRDGDDYIITGNKMWITNGTQADWMCMLVNTGNGPPHANKSLIVVPLREDGKRTKGVTVGRKLRKIGMHASDTALLHFEDVRVPARNLIGQEGHGFTYQMMQFQEERLYAALGSTVFCERALDHTIKYTQARQAFGRRIIENQAVHFRLSELATETEALRALTWHAIEMHVDGGDCTKLASMAKLKGGRLQREVADSCLQYWGGMGYMDESPIARMFRDGRLASIGGGADEVMLGIITKYLHLIPKK